MRKGELTIVTFADFFKAFGTIGCVPIKKLHTLDFSKHFFVLHEKSFVSTSVCSIRQQKIRTTICQFGVLQGSMFEPISFNLHVTDIAKNTSDSLCLRYADDSAISNQCKVNDINRCCQKQLVCNIDICNEPDE